MVNVIGVFVSLFLAVLLFTKKERKQADYILGWWMVFVAIHLFAYYTFTLGWLFKYTWLINFNLPYPFLHGPFLYLYTRSLASKTPLDLKYFLLHFLLPFGFTMSYLPILLLPVEQKLAIMETPPGDFAAFFQVVSLTLSVSGLIYMVITFLLLQKHRRNILEQFSAKEKITLDWLRFLYYGMNVLWILIIFIEKDELIFGGATVFVIMIGYFGIRQVGIFQSNERPELVEEVLESLSPPDVKYAKSGLGDEEAKQIHRRLQECMLTEKPYLNPQLSLKELSEILHVNSNYLSQVINEIEKKNFYDYINGLRVAEFKDRLQKPENSKYTLLSIAFDSGFNSKATFNRIFKNATGLSPSEYQKEVSISK